MCLTGRERLLTPFLFGQIAEVCYFTRALRAQQSCPRLASSIREVVHRVAQRSPLHPLHSGGGGIVDRFPAYPKQTNK